MSRYQYKSFAWGDDHAMGWWCRQFFWGTNEDGEKEEEVIDKSEVFDGLTAEDLAKWLERNVPEGIYAEMQSGKEMSKHDMLFCLAMGFTI